MKTKLVIIAVLSVATSVATAQTFSPARIDNQAVQSQQIMQSGTTYQGTVYEPFSNTTPSEQSQIGASYSPAQAPSGPRRDKIGGPDANQGQEFPVGEPWIMLAFAAAFAGVMYVRQRRKATMQGADKSGSLVR